MFAVVYAMRSVGPGIFDPDVGINFAMMVHGGQEFVWASPVRRRCHLHRDLGKGHLREDGKGFLRLRIVSTTNIMARGPVWQDRTNIVRGV